MPDFQGAVFDLDGTLLDSMNVWERVDVLFLRQYGLAVPPDYTEQMRTKSFHEAAVYTAARFQLTESPDEIIAEWHRMAAEEYRLRVSLKPYAKAYLLALKRRGVRLGVATALTAALYQPALERHGLYGLFDAFVSVHEAARGKGYPDVYLLAAKRLGLPPEQCIAFEDILPGIRGIKAAGMRACGVYDACSAHEETEIRQTADCYIYSFSELLEPKQDFAD